MEPWTSLFCFFLFRDGLYGPPQGRIAFDFPSGWIVVAVDFGETNIRSVQRVVDGRFFFCFHMFRRLTEEQIVVAGYD